MRGHLPLEASSCPPPDSLRDPDRFARWIQEAIKVPLGEVRNKSLGHFAFMDRLSIRSGGLTPDKQEALRQLSAQKKQRAWLGRFMKSIGEFTPPLYCGETSDLPARVRDHLAGDSGFGTKITDSVFLSWSDLELLYYPFGPAHGEDEAGARSKTRRTLLEFLATSLTLSGYVDRRG